MTKAAVFIGVGQPLDIRTDVEVEAPHEGELKVRMGASGVCHSDQSVQNGTIPLPVNSILGHEGAGVVEEVGAGVEGFAPGDHVVISWVPQCGECFYCKRGQGPLCERSANAVVGGLLLDGTTRATSGGKPLFQMSGAGTFSEVAVIPAISAVKVPKDMDLAVAALIGCGVLTGLGAAFHTAEIREGDTVAVLGCGGVGLNVIQGARIKGAARIIAVDLNPTKLELAKQFGATDTVDASTGNPVMEVMRLADERGADVVFEVIGLKETIDQAINMTRRGGETILVGVPRMDVALQIPAFLGLVLQHKTVKGCWYGSSNVREDVPRYVELYRSGQIKLDELVSRRIGVDDVNEAFEVMKTGEVARSVIVY